MTSPPERRTLRSAGVLGAAAAALAAWSLFEAQWVEEVELEVPVAGLHPDLDGLRILHLSDFHLGTLSLNGRALGKALDWADSRAYDLAVVTGDLLSRRRGTETLVGALASLRAPLGTFAVLGNHDVAETRDPFSRPGDPAALDRGGAILLADTSRVVERGSARIQVAGLSPEGWWAYRRPGDLADAGADLRILLCHFPDVIARLRPGDFDLVLAGHLHGGQICLPHPRGKLRLEHLRARYWEGLHWTRAGILHVSRGLGTSFVPFRFLARPEVTVLTLRGEN